MNVFHTEKGSRRRSNPGRGIKKSVYRDTFRLAGAHAGDGMKFRDVIRILEEDGWRFHSQKGSHQQFKHPIKPGRVTVAGHPGHDVHPKTLATIFRQAGIVKE